MYQAVKDLAGPIATMMAAAIAALITWRFSLRQTQIAKQQADTALDQLRYNLFAKRYAIYEAAKELVRLVINESNQKDFTALAVAPYYRTLDEARFFFSDDTCAWLRSLRNDCQKLLEAQRGGAQSRLGSSARLVSLLDQMPARFERELQFPQLTQRDVPSPDPPKWKQGFLRLWALGTIAWLTVVAADSIYYWQSWVWEDPWALTTHPHLEWGFGIPLAVLVAALAAGVAIRWVAAGFKSEALGR